MQDLTHMTLPLYVIFHGNYTEHNLSPQSASFPSSPFRLAITLTLPQIPSLYDGDLHKEQEVLAWLIEQLHTDEIEDITDEMLDKLIRESNHLAVLFCECGREDVTVWRV